MRRTLVGIVSVIVAGCAGVTVKAPTDINQYVKDNRDDLGITYYEPMLVLVAMCAEGGALKYEINTMPDYDKPRVIEWSAGFGSAHPNFTLADGWRLDSFEAEVDSGAGAAIEALGALGVAGIEALALRPGESPPAHVVQAGIYPIVWEPSGKEGVRGRWKLESPGAPWIPFGTGVCPKGGGEDWDGAGKGGAEKPAGG